MRPLRPATDLRFGGPLPRQLANQPRPPPKADCSFDLAMLCGISLGFPRLSPTQGQVVTCYSPGRHYTHGLLHFPVRLACVRHAASVDSEPGSNSHLKPVRLPTGSWQTDSASSSPLPAFARNFEPKAESPSSPSKRSDGLSCEIARIRTRDFHLTTGTFNLVVKDRIAFRLSGAPSVQANPLARANPTVLETF